jgi:hypothetical protein
MLVRAFTPSHSFDALPPFRDFSMSHVQLSSRLVCLASSCDFRSSLWGESSGRMSSSLDGYASEVRRERDSIREQMERVVAQMQKLEAELEASAPGGGGGGVGGAAANDAKRRELSALRQELAELRGRMRRAMEAAQRQAQAMSAADASPTARLARVEAQDSSMAPTSFTPAQPHTSVAHRGVNFGADAPASPPRAMTPAAAAALAQSIAPHSYALAPSSSTTTFATPRSALPPPTSSSSAPPPLGAAPDFVTPDLLAAYSAHAGGGSSGGDARSPQQQQQRLPGGFEEARAGLLRRHQVEKMQLHELFVSLQRQMDARHDGELGILGERLREEELRLRELEHARARWEDAHRVREMCFRAGDGTTPPEIAVLRQQPPPPPPSSAASAAYAHSQLYGR